MKFIVSSSYLLKQLQVLGSVINSSNTLPILDNFLFELDNTQLTVSASDLETTMSATLEIDSNSQGSVAVPAKLFVYAAPLIAAVNVIDPSTVNDASSGFTLKF